MQTIGAQALAVMLVLAIVLGPASCAMAMLSRRKKQERLLRRSPLSTKLLRTPGHTLREQFEDGRSDLGLDLMVLMFVPAIVLASLFVTSLTSARQASLVVLAIAAFGVVAFSIYQTRKLLSRASQLEQWRLGLDAEMAVGQELDQLMRQGAAVFHDLAADGFNLDHVVIARQGVFAVETKGYRKPNRNGGAADATVIYDGELLKFPQWSGAGALRQTSRQASWLAEWLTGATGQKVAVTPVLALPGWFVERKGRGAVLVFSGSELRDHLLKARSASPLSEEQFQRVVHQVDQRCRDVKPFYRPIGETA